MPEQATIPEAPVQHHRVKLSQGFAPIVGDDAAVLILGTLPSQKSLRDQQYYAHPRNAFWKLMGDLFGIRPELPYDERCWQLARKNVAVWDVLRASRRPGSLDAAIDVSTAEPNDFKEFFLGNRKIQRVYCNGRKAAELYQRLVIPLLGDAYRNFDCTTLPSTSPAHAAMSYDDKLAKWRQIV